jgi:archaellum biogenesis ATPase FlaH
MDILESITQNKFLLVMLNETEYEKKLFDMIKQMNKTGKKICYVCLSSTYKDVVDVLGKKGIDVNSFFFIDVLSSHYGESSGMKNCIFVSSPVALEEIRDAIIKAIKEEKCGVVIFDTISSLLIYQESYSIVKFTNNFLANKLQDNIKKVFVVLKNSERLSKENMSLAKDIGMFADKTVEL